MARSALAKLNTGGTADQVGTASESVQADELADGGWRRSNKLRRLFWPAPLSAGMLESVRFTHTVYRALLCERNNESRRSAKTTYTLLVSG